MKPVFEKKIIGEIRNDVGPSQMNTLGAVGDFNGDGYHDYVTCGRNGQMVWFENKGKSEEWVMHKVADIKGQECGGCTIDLTGNGLCDIINGSDYSNDEVCWWENTGELDRPFKQRVAAKTGNTQIHDTMIGEIKNDGVKYLVFTNQGTGTSIYCVPIPSDPTQEPWPSLEKIAEDKWLPNERHTWSELGKQPDEGIAIADVDNDGNLEVVTGVSYYKWVDNRWKCVKFTDEIYITNKIVVGDIDNDGKNEIILSEGDAYIYGHDEGCKLAWFKPEGDNYEGKWVEHVIDNGLWDAHSIALADLCGNGNLDLFIGEIGAVPRNSDSEDYIKRQPRLMIYENDGKGNFTTRHIIDEGTGIHEAVVIDLNGDGKLDIIGKPLHGAEKWNVHVWYRRG